MKYFVKNCTRRIDAHVLMANLFVMLVSYLGIVRAREWIETNPEDLKTVSPLYGVLNTFGSLDSLGITLLISSLLIFFSIFFKNVAVYYLLTIGSFFGGIIYFFYSLACLAGAELYVSSHTAMALMVAHLFLFMIGVAGLWKKK